MQYIANNPALKDKVKTHYLVSYMHDFSKLACSICEYVVIHLRTRLIFFTCKSSGSVRCWNKVGKKCSFVLKISENPPALYFVARLKLILTFEFLVAKWVGSVTIQWCIQMYPSQYFKLQIIWNCIHGRNLILIRFGNHGWKKIGPTVSILCSHTFFSCLRVGNGWNGKRSHIS